MAAPKKPEDEKAVRMTISIPPELRERLHQYCQDNERQMSWVIQKALSEWLDKN